MKRSGINLCLIAVISLACSVIWHGPASAAVVPSIVPLGEIRNQENLISPARIDVDSSGSIYVADARKRAVVKFDKYGEFVRLYNAAPVSGRGVAVTPDGSRLYVAGPTQVSILDGASGEVVGTLGSGEGEFKTAGEIDLDASGFVYAADSGDRVVKVYTSAGAFEFQFGSFGIAPGQFRTLWAMSVNEAAGEVYVADVETYSTTVLPKIQIFDLAGNLLPTRTLVSTTSFGTPSMTFFGGMAFDQSGRGYFLDTFRTSIRTLGLPSTYLANYAVAGLGVGELSSPTDVIFDPVTSRLFVVCDGARVEIFGIDGGTNPENANVKPEVPTALSPVNGSEVASATPELLLQNAVDANGDVLTYQVKVLKEDVAVAQYSDLPAGAGNTAVQVATALEENANYHWAAQASDGKDVSGWTALQSFYVNAVQEAPTSPVLDLPEDGALLEGSDALVWQVSVDPDPFDQVGYEVEIAADPSFAGDVLRQPVETNSVILADLADYASLVDGATYYWRVNAVDNHGMVSTSESARSFVYDTTVLKVSANVPGAKVYVGGNYAYAGRYVGDAPVELRDLAPGAASVVVEHAGFEIFVAQIRPSDRENIDVYAAMVPAITPADLKARPLQAAGVEIVVGGDAAPFSVDFDNDGVIDLLVADATGDIQLYKGALDAYGTHSYAAGVSLGLGLVPGASPFVADWNNDGRKDILVGATDGSVVLFLNNGNEDAPAFAGGEFLAVAGVPINVGSAAVPVVFDADDDQDKDLIIGSGAGSVWLFRNDGSDDAPQLASATSLTKVAGSVAPFVVDWDADGTKDLLLAASEHLYIYKRQAGGTYAAATVLTVGSDLLGKSGKASSGAFVLGDRLRVFAYDADGKKGKDLVVGNAAGAVRLAHANGSDYVTAYTSALVEKIAQINEMLVQLEQASASASLLDEIAAAVVAGDFKNAGKTAGILEVELPAGTEAAFAAHELSVLLNGN